MHNTTIHEESGKHTITLNTNSSGHVLLYTWKTTLFSILLGRVLEADLGSGVRGAHGALDISLSWGSSGEESSSGEGSQGGESSLLLLWSLHMNKSAPYQPQNSTASNTKSESTVT